ncbi:sensor histidine kinase, partial [Nonomuraea lactucae]|uniref:sensor histidine kinase n=1 Tax=Nonomuraea lactucae TaxID=2249762 RepID=UPI001F0601B1
PDTLLASPDTAGRASPDTASLGTASLDPAERASPTPAGRPDGPATARHEVLAAERARIAGEVHDAAGHGLAAIAMQAGIALVALDDDPEQTRASLQAIRETSVTALTELRAALDRLASPPPDGPELASPPPDGPELASPPPDGPELASPPLDGPDAAGPLGPVHGDLTALIGRVRAAGLRVDVEPTGLPVPARLHEAVYRVVRESLTNVLRHAGPTRALVRASDGPREFVLEVADQGGAATGRTPHAEGRGLAGMRATVTAAGGRF